MATIGTTVNVPAATNFVASANTTRSVTFENGLSRTIHADGSGFVSVPGVGNIAFAANEMPYRNPDGSLGFLTPTTTGNIERTVREDGTQLINDYDTAGNLRASTTRSIANNPDGQTTIDVVENNVTGERTLIVTVPDSAEASGFYTRVSVLPSAAEVTQEKTVLTPAERIEVTNDSYTQVANLLGAIRDNDKAGKIISSVRLVNDIGLLHGRGNAVFGGYMTGVGAIAGMVGAANDALFEVRKVAA